MSAVSRKLAAVAAVLGAIGAAGVGPAVSAAFEITDFKADVYTASGPVPVSEPPWTTPVAGLQLGAGAHPDVTVDIRFPYERPDYTAEPVLDTDVEFPRGFGINLASTPQCTIRQLGSNACPEGSQIGVAQIFVPGADSDTNGFPLSASIFNLVPVKGVPAQAGFEVQGTVSLLTGSVRSGGDYGITVGSDELSSAVSISRLKLTLWGVPSDPVHRSEDTPSNPDPTAQAVTSNPTRCDAPMRFRALADSRLDPTVVARDVTTASDGTPLALTGCEAVPFAPSIEVTPTTTAPDSPTGADITVRVPQDTTAGALQTSHLRNLSLTLPDGMTVNPAAADGLAACSPEQIGLGSAAPPTCPNASSLGDVSIDSPLLTEPLTGKAYLAQQGANPFGTTLALYLVASAQGVTLKLPGRIDPDPRTGQLRVTFSDQPELPFSRLTVSLDGGSRGVLTTPAACGPQTVTGTATPWSGGADRPVSSTFSIDCLPGLGGFAPTFAAATSASRAGLFSPLAFHFGRPDGQQALTGVEVTLPPGLIARPAAVTPCTEAQASADACPAGARVGSARVLTGAGPAPFPLGGEAFLTGPYKGAPYGLLVRFRAIAGPLDLGTVVVRQALFIDPDTTQVRAISDPLPTVVGGVPIRLRELSLTLDQPGFTVNPTSCAPDQITGTLGGAGGSVATLAARFQATDCAKLALEPQLRLSLTGRKRNLRKGGHPGITARLTQPAGQSNLERVEVKLPLSLALDPSNAETLCEAEAAARKEPSCPQGAAVGTARVASPLLPEPLTGPIYLAKGVRTTASGRQVRTLPTLVLPLRGNSLQINVRANTAVRRGKLVTQFDGIPDAAVSRFDLALDGGRRGILTSTKAICRSSRGASVRFRGHSGRLVTASRALRAACS